MPPVVTAMDEHIDVFERKINELDAKLFALLETSGAASRTHMSASALQRHRYKTNSAFKRLQAEVASAKTTLEALKAAKRDVISALFVAA